LNSCDGLGYAHTNPCAICQLRLKKPTCIAPARRQTLGWSDGRSGGSGRAGTAGVAVLAVGAVEAEAALSAAAILSGAGVVAGLAGAAGAACASHARRAVWGEGEGWGYRWVLDLGLIMAEVAEWPPHYSINRRARDRSQEKACHAGQEYIADAKGLAEPAQQRQRVAQRSLLTCIGTAAGHTLGCIGGRSGGGSLAGSAGVAVLAVGAVEAKAALSAAAGCSGAGVVAGLAGTAGAVHAGHAGAAVLR
jgi:hypothetical protein